MEPKDCPHHDDVLTLKLELTNMNKEIGEIKELVTGIGTKFDDFIIAVDKKYVKLEDFNRLSNKMNDLSALRFLINHPKITLLVFGGLYVLTITEVREYLIRLFI
ncbi:MAG: hypothetical protein WCY05_06475 [Candidatus Omnitrophota bacterium]